MKRGTENVSFSRGMTLPELMVGLAVGLFVVTIAISTFVSTRTLNVVNSSSTRMTENARLATETLHTDLRSAGFGGCRTLEQRLAGSGLREDGRYELDGQRVDRELRAADGTPRDAVVSVSVSAPQRTRSDSILVRTFSVTFRLMRTRASGFAVLMRRIYALRVGMSITLLPRDPRPRRAHRRGHLGRPPAPAPVARFADHGHLDLCRRRPGPRDR